MKNQKQWQKIYIDAFAGPGVSQLRVTEDSTQGVSLFNFDADEVEETESYLKGSPQIALEIDNAFDHYVFIERDSVRAASLRSLVHDNQADRSISILEGDAATELSRVAQRIKKSKHRAVAFIDPYGLNISWAAIQQLAKTGAAEIVLNFAWSMAINRLLVKSGEIPPNWVEMLDTYFGDHDWYDLAYEITDGFFGQDIKKAEHAEKEILRYYLRKLETCFGFVGPPMLIRNTRGNPLYYLIWAGPNKAGLEGAEHILSQGEVIQI